MAVDLIAGDFLCFHRASGQSLGLLVDERPCAGGAGPLVLKYSSSQTPSVMFDLEERRVLSAHADDGSGIGLQEQDAQDLADGFKFIEEPRVSRSGSFRGFR
jgi:hypothetical protein